MLNKKTHLDYNISISLNSINNMAQSAQTPSSPTNPFPNLDDITETGSTVSLHEFKPYESNRHVRSGSEITWNYKRQHSNTLDIPYIDDVSRSLTTTFSVRDRSNRLRSETNRSSVANRSNRLSRHSKEMTQSPDRILNERDEDNVSEKSISKRTSFKDRIKSVLNILCCTWECIPSYPRIQVTIEYVLFVGKSCEYIFNMN